MQSVQGVQNEEKSDGVERLTGSLFILHLRIECNTTYIPPDGIHVSSANIVRVRVRRSSITIHHSIGLNRGENFSKNTKR